MADSPTSGAQGEDARPELSLSVPCYNEEAVLRRTVTRLVEEFRARGISLELVLVDNGSTDGTAALIDELIAAGLPVSKIALDKNAGYGGGILAGLDACRGRFVGYMHADGQVEPVDVFRLYDIAAAHGGAVLVQVNRRFRLDGWQRRVTTAIYNLLINSLFGGLGTSDVNGSPKLLRREDYQQLALSSRDWFLDAELMIKAGRMGLPVIEVNVLAQMRLGGRSKVNWQANWQFVGNLIRWRLGRR